MASKSSEARLKASVAREIQTRLMEEDLKVQSDSIAAALWATKLGQKDVAAQKKIRETSMLADSKVKGEIQKDIRRQRLAELFQRDELKYQEELNMRGLAFRRPEC